MLKPLADRIVVRQDEAHDIASAVIFIPQSKSGMIDQHRQFGRTGRVVAVGPGKRDKHGERRRLTVRPGMRVAWEELNHSTYRDGIETFHVLQEADVSCVIEE